MIVHIHQEHLIYTILCASLWSNGSKASKMIPRDEHEIVGPVNTNLVDMICDEVCCGVLCCNEM